MSGFNTDYNKRGASLPLGCSDLLDVIKREEAMAKSKESESTLLPPLETLLPKPMGGIEIGSEITVKDLAMKLGWKSFMVIAVLIQRKIFVANDQHVLDFDLAASIAAEHGYQVSRVD